MIRPDLSDRATHILTHLLVHPDRTHLPARVAADLGISAQGAASVFRLLIAVGWAVRRDAEGALAIALTPRGAAEGPAAIAAAEAKTSSGTPLAVVDRQDPALADLVRVKMGWPARHRVAA